MSQILGVNDPYVIPGTMGGGGSSLPEDSAGYLYNDGSGNLSYDEAPTPEPAGSDTQIQFNDGGVMAGSSALTFDKTKKTLSLINATTDFSSSALYGRCCDQQATALASSYQAPIASLGSSSKSIRILDGNQQPFAGITGDSLSIYDYCNFENKKAQGYISGSASNVAAGQTVTIGSTVYTFATTPTVEGDVAVGANVTASLQNLYAAINGTGTLGVEHYCTSAHPDVTASAFNSAQKRILLEAKTAGAAGESITLAESSALSKSGSTLVRPADWLTAYLLQLSMDSEGSYGTQVKHGNVTGISAVLAMSGFNGTMYCNPVGHSVQISSAVTDALAYDRGTMTFFQGNTNILGGHYTDIFGFKVATISVSSYGSADNAYCFYAATPAVNTSSGAFVTNAYGLYVEDFTSSGATNVYGLYIAGATQNNYIAGNLEVAGTLTATIAAAGTDTQVIYNSSGSYAGASTVIVEDASAYTAVVGAGLALNVGDLRIYKHSSTANNIIHSTINDVTVDFWSNTNGGLRFICGSDFISSPGATTPPVWSVLSATGVVTMNLSSYIDDATGAVINIIKQRKTVADPGQDADVIGTVAFKGYNDRAAGSGGPELTTFASMYATIADASDTTEDGQIDFSFITGGSPQNSVRMDGSGVKLPYAAGGGTLNYMTAGGANGYRMMYLGGNAAFVLYDDLNTAYGQWMSKGGNMFFMSNETQSLGTSAFRCLGIGNLSVVAPTAVATDHVQIWCADYAAGDARLYLMAEASTNKTIFGSGKIVFSDPNVNHGMTTYMATDEYFKIEETSAGLGGASIFAATDDYGVTPLTFKALLGNAASNDSCISFVFGVKSGSGITAYGAMGTPWCVAFYNNTTLLGGWVNDGFSVNGAAYIRIKDMDVDNQCTTLTGGAPYTCGQLSELHATKGGMQVLGLSGNKDQEALVVHGNLSSSTTPSDTTPALVLKGSKYSGSGFNPGALSASQTVMQILNYTTVLATLKGGNYWQLTNSTTAPGSIATDAVQLWCADYAAGDARLYLMGEKNTNTIALGAGCIQFDPTTMADDSVEGETFIGTAGENIAWGDVVYLKSDGKFWKADFNAGTTCPAVAFCTATINADASGEFLRRGWIRDDSAYNFTFGAQAGTIYLGESGAITQTAPSGSGDQVQVLGWALEADIWYFDPQFVIVEV